MHTVQIDNASADFLIEKLYEETRKNPHNRPASEITDMNQTILNVENALLEADVRNTQPVFTHPDLRAWEHPELGDVAPLIIEDLRDRRKPVMYLNTPFYDMDDVIEIFDWLTDKRVDALAF